MLFMIACITNVSLITYDAIVLLNVTVIVWIVEVLDMYNLLFKNKKALLEYEVD